MRTCVDTPLTACSEGLKSAIFVFRSVNRFPFFHDPSKTHAIAIAPSGVPVQTRKFSDARCCEYCCSLGPSRLDIAPFDKGSNGIDERIVDRFELPTRRRAHVDCFTQHLRQHAAFEPIAFVIECEVAKDHQRVEVAPHLGDREVDGFGALQSETLNEKRAVYRLEKAMRPRTANLGAAIFDVFDREQELEGSTLELGAELLALVR